MDVVYRLMDLRFIVFVDSKFFIKMFDKSLSVGRVDIYVNTLQNYLRFIFLIILRPTRLMISFIVFL